MAEPVAVDSMSSSDHRALTMAGAGDPGGVRVVQRLAAVMTVATGLEPPSAVETDATTTKWPMMAKDGAGDADVGRQ